MKESNADKMSRAYVLGAADANAVSAKEIAALKQQVKDLEEMVKRGGKENER